MHHNSTTRALWFDETPTTKQRLFVRLCADQSVFLGGIEETSNSNFVSSYYNKKLKSSFQVSNRINHRCSNNIHVESILLFRIGADSHFWLLWLLLIFSSLGEMSLEMKELTLVEITICSLGVSSTLPRPSDWMRTCDNSVYFSAGIYTLSDLFLIYRSLQDERLFIQCFWMVKDLESFQQVISMSPHFQGNQLRLS